MLTHNRIDSVKRLFSGQQTLFLNGCWIFQSTTSDPLTQKSPAAFGAKHASKARPLTTEPPTCCCFLQETSSCERKDTLLKGKKLTIKGMDDEPPLTSHINYGFVGEVEDNSRDQSTGSIEKM